MNNCYRDYAVDNADELTALLRAKGARPLDEERKEEDQEVSVPDQQTLDLEP